MLILSLVKGTVTRLQQIKWTSTALLYVGGQCTGIKIQFLGNREFPTLQVLNIYRVNNTILYIEPVYQQLLNETTEQKPTLKRVVVASGNKIAIGNNFDEALTNLLSQSAGNIEITDPDNIDDLINEIIKANSNVKNSSSNNDWRLFGEDMQTLTSLIDELDNAVKEQKANETANEIANEVNTNTVANEVANSVVQ